jgi:hypothetical protein
MSDRSAWLDQWCPECHAAPGARCGRWPWGRRGTRGRAVPIAHLHVARGWLERPCPTCKALAGERCSTPTGREASRVHTARLRQARRELVWRPEVWEELERRGATVALVPFWGRAGSGGRTDTIKLLRLEDGELLDVERWTYRDELCHALEAPVWERFGTFVGHPLIRGEVVWSAEDRSVVISGRRGDRRLEEIVE